MANLSCWWSPSLQYKIHYTVQLHTLVSWCGFFLCLTVVFKLLFERFDWPSTDQVGQGLYCHLLLASLSSSAAGCCLSGYAAELLNSHWGLSARISQGDQEFVTWITKELRMAEIIFQCVNCRFSIHLEVMLCSQAARQQADFGT